MDPLNEYLQGDYLVDILEIERIQHRAKQAMQVLLEFFDDGWPYELATGKERGRSINSQSTMAMILFALAAVTGRVRESVLVPLIRLRPLDLNESQRADLDKVLQSGLAKLVSISGASKPSGPVTRSATYGPDDPFTLTWFLELLKARTKARERVVQSASTLVTRVFDDPNSTVLKLPKRSGEAVAHAFPLLRVVHLYAALRQAGQPPNVNANPVARALEDRLHLHLSLSDIRDSAFDAAELVFSLEGWLLCNPASPNFSVVDRVFAVLTERQRENPYWRPLRPFKVTPQGLILLPQSVEIANSLLRICRLLADEGPAYFSNNVDLFKRYTRWLESRRVEGRTSDGRDFLGWESEHTHVPGRVHLWQTSQALLYLDHYAAMLQNHVAHTTLTAARLLARVPPRAPSCDKPTASAKELWSCWAAGEPMAGQPHGSHYRVYDRIGAAFVEPRSGAAGERAAAKPSYSMLLYGPPGTGKSTIVEELARALQYRFVTITPSDFISAGSEWVEGKARAIFTMLQEQSDLVILFDEIDRLLLDRGSEWYRAQTDLFKLLTPGMLTKVNDLAKRKQSIFAIATNFREQIDPAIKRPGRIDHQFLVMPPDLKQRGEILGGKNGLKQWRAISPPDQDALQRLTVLFSWTELTDLAKQVERDQERAPEPRLADAVKKAIEQVRPAISLDMYKARFDVKLPDLKPLEEFALLVYLKLESSTASWGEHLRSLDDWVIISLDEALKSGAVRDPELAEALDRELRRWG